MSHLDAALSQVAREAQHDPVTRPLHYTQGAVESIDAIESAIEGLDSADAYLTGTVIKYVWRWRHKGTPLMDLEKAQRYLSRLIDRVKAEAVPCGMPRNHPGETR